MSTVPYTVHRLMRRQFRTLEDRGTLTTIGTFSTREEAEAARLECEAAETDSRYHCEVVRIVRPSGLADLL